MMGLIGQTWKRSNACWSGLVLIGRGLDHKGATHPLCNSETPHPHNTGLVVSQSFGGYSGGDTPGPIPNPEAKPASADGTAPPRVWESRTPPNTNHRLGNPVMGFPNFYFQRFYKKRLRYS